MPTSSAGHLQRFLDEVVNLKPPRVAEYLSQVRYLTEGFVGYVNEHHGFELVNMRPFGSLAKGTATSQLREIDVAVALRPPTVPITSSSVLHTVRELLLRVYPTKDPSDFVVDPPAITVVFRGSKLSVDLVPVILTGEAEERGLVVPSGRQAWVETSIPLHLQFIDKRKVLHPDFIPLVRLTKWWRTAHHLPVSSFTLELIWAYLLDHERVPTGDYSASLLAFFAYLERSRLGEPIGFTDYPAPARTTGSDPVQITDPVNPANNVAARLSTADRGVFLRAAEEALDLLAQATTAHTKEQTLLAHKRLFGAEFQI